MYTIYVTKFVFSPLCVPTYEGTCVLTKFLKGDAITVVCTFVLCYYYSYFAISYLDFLPYVIL